MGPADGASHSAQGEWVGHAHLWVTACDHCGSKLSVSDLALFYRWESEAWPGAGDRPGQLRSTLACLWVSLECQDHHLWMLLQDFISQRRNGIVFLQQELLGAFYSLSGVSPRGPQGWQALGPRRCVELAIPRTSRHVLRRGHPQPATPNTGLLWTGRALWHHTWPAVQVHTAHSWPRGRAPGRWEGRAGQALGSWAAACQAHTWHCPGSWPMPIRNSLYVTLIYLWGPGTKVMQLSLLLFFWLETPVAII